jgi:Leucine zipper with capping helix domain
VIEKEKQQEQLEAKVEQLGSGREATDEHGALLDAIAAKKARVAKLDQELERFAEFDPDHVQKINESMRPVRDAANRWTDNLFCCQSWIVEKFSIERSEFCKQFEVPPDLDYLE